MTGQSMNASLMGPVLASIMHACMHSLPSNPAYSASFGLRSVRFGIKWGGEEKGLGVYYTILVCSMYLICRRGEGGRNIIISKYATDGVRFRLGWRGTR